MNETDIYREWPPPATWTHAVACLWEQQVVGARVQRVLPDGHFDLLFFDSGDLEVVGLADVVALPALPAGTRLRGVRFRPEAVGPALRTDASLLKNLSLPAQDVLGAREVGRLMDPQGLDAWVRGIKPDRRVALALGLLKSRSVEEVADLLPLSSRHLRRALLAHIGLTPRTYQRIVRLQRFVRAADQGVSLAAAAADAGYADQAHLSREVKRFSALTPAQLVQERRAGQGVQ